MTLFLITLALFLLVFVAMAIGYLIKQKALTGSCGGLATVGIEKACNCDKPCEKRLERERQAQAKEKAAKYRRDQIDITKL